MKHLVIHESYITYRVPIKIIRGQRERTFNTRKCNKIKGSI